MTGSESSPVGHCVCARRPPSASLPGRGRRGGAAGGRARRRAPGAALGEAAPELPPGRAGLPPRQPRPARGHRASPFTSNTLWCPVYEATSNVALSIMRRAALCAKLVFSPGRALVLLNHYACVYRRSEGLHRAPAGARPRRACRSIWRPGSRSRWRRRALAPARQPLLPQ